MPSTARRSAPTRFHPVRTHRSLQREVEATRRRERLLRHLKLFLLAGVALAFGAIQVFGL